MRFDACLGKLDSLLPYALLIMMSMAFVIGCTTLQLPKYDVMNIGAHSSIVSIPGLTVNAHPLLDSEESKKYFGADLPSKQILAIFVSIENTSEETSYIIPKESITFTHVNNVGERNFSEFTTGDNKTGEVLGCAGLVFTPLMVVGLTMVGDKTVVRHAFKSNEYQSKTLSPADSAHGFLYFNLPNELSNHKNGMLTIVARDPIGNNSIEIKLPIQLEGGN